MKVLSWDYNANDFQSIRRLEYRITFKNSSWRHTYLTVLDITWLLLWHHVFSVPESSRTLIVMQTRDFVCNWNITVIIHSDYFGSPRKFKWNEFRGRCGKMITSANGTAWFSKGSSAYEDLQISKQKKKNANMTIVLSFFFRFCFTSSFLYLW